MSSCGSGSSSSSSSTNITQEQANSMAEGLRDLPQSFAKVDGFNPSPSFYASYSIRNNWISDSASTNYLGIEISVTMNMRAEKINGDYFTENELSQIESDNTDFDISDYYSLGISAVEFYGSLSESSGYTSSVFTFGSGSESPLSYAFFENKDHTIDGSTSVNLSIPQSEERNGEFVVVSYLTLSYSLIFNQLYYDFLSTNNYKIIAGTISGLIASDSLDLSVSYSLTFTPTLIYGTVGNRSVSISN